MPLVPWYSRWPQPALRLNLFDALSMQLWDPFDFPTAVSQVSLEESQDAITLSIPLNGFDPNDFQVEVVGNAVLLSGQQRMEQYSDRGRQVSLRRVQQRLPLPTAVDDSQMTMDVRDDILWVTLPKRSRGWRTIPARIAESLSGAPTDAPPRSQPNAIGNRLQRGWQQTRRWLGRQLRAASEALLRD